MPDLYLPPAMLSRFPQHATAIAEIIASWNTLEDSFPNFLTLFTGTDPQQADLVMAAMASSQARLDVVVAAGRFVLKNNTARFETLTEVFDFVEKRLRVRNQYAHGVYVTNEKGELCIMRRKYEFPADPKSIRVVYISELHAELTHIVKATRRLVEFYNLLSDETPDEIVQAWRRIWTQRRLPAPTPPADPTNPA